MSTSDNNLLNFLQKQSLFNGSPTKANRKMSSRSREKKSEQLFQGGANTTTNFNQVQSFNAPQLNTNATFSAGSNNFNANFSTGQANNATFTAGQTSNAFSGSQNANTFGAGQNTNAFSAGGQTASFSAGGQIGSFSAGQNINAFSGGQAATFTGGQSNANAFGSTEIHKNSFSTSQGNANLSFGQNAGQSFNSSQSLNFQANIQDNNTQLPHIHLNSSPNHFGSSFQNQQHIKDVDVKVQSPTRLNPPNIQGNFQMGSGNNFNSSSNLRFNQTIKGNQAINGNYSYNTYQEQIVIKGGTAQNNESEYLQNVETYAKDSTNYARIEAMKRLDILAEKVRIQMNSLNSKLEIFSSQMMTVVVEEFNFVKTKVYEILEETFMENEKYCRGFVSTVETQFNQEVLTARAILLKESENIAMMRIDINKPHWQSNAVFVSVEFQARVNNVVSQVKQMQVKATKHTMNASWQMNQKRDLQRDLLDRVIMRLQRERQMAFGKNI